MIYNCDDFLHNIYFNGNKMLYF